MVPASNQISRPSLAGNGGVYGRIEDQCGRRKRLLLAQGAPALPAARGSWEGEPSSRPRHPPRDSVRQAKRPAARGACPSPRASACGVCWPYAWRSPGTAPARLAASVAGAGPLAPPARPLVAPSAPGHLWSPGGPRPLPAGPSQERGPVWGVRAPPGRAARPVRRPRGRRPFAPG